VEAFLEAGYAVIFLTRKHSIQPFTKGLPSGDIVDCLTQALDGGAGGGAGAAAGGFPPGFSTSPRSPPAVGPAAAAPAGQGAPPASPGLPPPPATPRTGAASAASDLIARAVASARAAGEAGTLLRIRFESLAQYLTALRSAALALAPCGRAASFYLAAAVSDFYLPSSAMADHKIQSSEGELSLTLARTPKMLGALRAAWAPAAFVVGFKLETDPAILISKATRSISAYALHAVVANILETRKERVLLVTPASGEAGGGGGGGGGGEEGMTSDDGGDTPVAVETIDRPPGEPFIERALVARVVALHRAYMEEEGAGA